MNGFAYFQNKPHCTETRCYAFCQTQCRNFLRPSFNREFYHYPSAFYANWFHAKHTKFSICKQSGYRPGQHLRSHGVCRKRYIIKSCVNPSQIYRRQDHHQIIISIRNQLQIPEFELHNSCKFFGKLLVGCQSCRPVLYEFHTIWKYVFSLIIVITAALVLMF